MLRPPFVRACARSIQPQCWGAKERTLRGVREQGEAERIGAALGNAVRVVRSLALLGAFLLLGVQVPVRVDLRLQVLCRATFPMTPCEHSQKYLLASWLEGRYRGGRTASEMPEITSSGSMTLPRDLLILRPCASRTIECRYTCLNGSWPVSSRPIMTMRATQKNRMS